MQPTVTRLVQDSLAVFILHRRLCTGISPSWIRAYPSLHVGAYIFLRRWNEIFLPQKTKQNKKWLTDLPWYPKADQTEQESFCSSHLALSYLGPKLIQVLFQVQSSWQYFVVGSSLKAQAREHVYAAHWRPEKYPRHVSKSGTNLSRLAIMHKLLQFMWINKCVHKVFLHWFLRWNMCVICTIYSNGNWSWELTIPLWAKRVGR